MSRRAEMTLALLFVCCAIAVAVCAAAAVNGASAYYRLPKGDIMVEAGKESPFDVDLDDDEPEEGDLFEGDIELDDELFFTQTVNISGGFTTKNVVLKPGGRWPEGIVYFDYDLSFNQTELNAVFTAMEDIQRYTCVKFVSRKDQPTYMYLKKDKKRCSSPVGYNKFKGKTVVALRSPNCLKRGRIQHELLHALGLWHEHSRPDRDSSILVIWDNIIDGREKNFEAKTFTQSTTLGLPYDYNSVLHYRNNSFSRNKKTDPTILPRLKLPGAKMGQRIGMSKIDVAKLNRLYRCDTAKYYVGDDIRGAVPWYHYMEKNDLAEYTNKLTVPEPLGIW